VPYAHYTSNVERAVCTTKNTTESRVSIKKTFQNVVRSEIHINLEIDTVTLNRRRRRFCIRRAVYHIYQGPWRQYDGKCTSVYGI